MTGQRRGIGRQSGMGQRGGIGQRPQMSQQSQMGQQPQIGQQRMGQQTQPGQQQGMGEMRGEVGEKPKFEDHLTSDVVLVLDDFQKLETTAEWCSDQCVERGPELGTSARICRDVADIAHLGVQLMSRNPYRRIDVGEVMLNVFLDAREELGTEQFPPVKDTVSVLDRAIESLSKAIETVQTQGLGVQ